MIEAHVDRYEIEIAGLEPFSWVAPEEDKPRSRLITREVPIYTITEVD
jgi:hypothetical protein